MPASLRVWTNTLLVLSDDGHVLPSLPPAHGPAVTAPRWSPASAAYAAEARIGLPVTTLPMLRTYVPALGLAASVMPPDCAAMPPSARTRAHFTAAAPPAGPAGPAGPA